MIVLAKAAAEAHVTTVMLGGILQRARGAPGGRRVAPLQHPECALTGQSMPPAQLPLAAGPHARSGHYWQQRPYQQAMRTDSLVGAKE
jgi:hypothetical protein